ncbi:MAG: UDP-N-acetylmuramate dehydrogenase [Usitatibacter sp.]
MNSELRGLLSHDEPMAKHVSWRAGGAARTFYRPADVLDLAAFLRTRAPSEEVMFVGLGSNLLVRDGGFAGAIVFTHHALIGIEVESEVATPRGTLAFRAGAGVPAPHLARFVAKHGGAGAEWMAGIPGTVGGALAMNAGCYGGETWDHVLAVETVDRAGTLRHRSPADYELGYRHVALRPAGEEWFVSGVFGFAPGEEGPAMERIKELLQKRVASQPLSQPNAGSVFRNPPGDHAARLIESCGLKGYAIGGAQVSPKHANFIVNQGSASANDIETLIDHVQAAVLMKTGIELVKEVRIVGERKA